MERKGEYKNFPDPKIPKLIENPENNRLRPCETLEKGPIQAKPRRSASEKTNSQKASFGLGKPGQGFSFKVQRLEQFA